MVSLQVRSKPASARAAQARVNRCDPNLDETAEQYSQLATAYEKAAADPMVSSQQQATFARSAHWFRIHARLAEKNEQRAAHLSGSSAPGSANPVRVPRNVQERLARYSGIVSAMLSRQRDSRRL